MPKRCPTDALLPALLTAQDWVLGRKQALELGISRHSMDHRLATKQWQLLVPGVYLAAPTEASRRQMLIAALLYAGDDSAIDATDACHFHGVKAAIIDESRVHVVVPQRSAARSRGFVVVRRTNAPIRTHVTDRLRYVDPATAVVAAARRTRADRAALALLSDALQRRIVTYEQLLRAHVQASPRNAGSTDRALSQLGSGVRSAPEADFRLLAEASLVLPPLHYNCLLRLPTGRIISPDALCVEAGLVHETNGRAPHARADLFEDMQERHDAMTVAGLTVLHNSPRRVHSHGREVIGEFERCFVRLDGRGLPDGVELLRIAV